MMFLLGWGDFLEKESVGSLGLLSSLCFLDVIAHKTLSSHSSHVIDY